MLDKHIIAYLICGVKERDALKITRLTIFILENFIKALDFFVWTKYNLLSRVRSNEIIWRGS